MVLAPFQVSVATVVIQRHQQEALWQQESCGQIPGEDQGGISGKVSDTLENVKWLRGDSENPRISKQDVQIEAKKE